MHKLFVNTILLMLLVAVAGLIGHNAVAAGSNQSADSVWRSISVDELETTRAADAKAWIRPDTFSAVRLEPSALDAVLAAAPMEFSAQAKARPAILALPRPDGRLERFEVVESPMMHPDLEKSMAAKGWPMKTYHGTSMDRAATTVRLDWGGPAGLHAMVLSPEGDYYIDPYWQGDLRLYTSYLRSDYTRQGKGSPAQCLVENHSLPAPLASPTLAETRAARNTGGVLRTYRAAIAATGEYTAFHGGSQAQGLAAIITSFNRINMIYQRDFSIRMILVGNNINLIYTNAATDPYTDSNFPVMLGENQTNVDAVIGTANYDIGHVLGFGAGGLAALQSPCDVNQKAQGASGTGMPIGDPFDIDILAHEVGHQFGGRHTWTGTAGACEAMAFDGLSSYEPGSGSTIQAYAGTCNGDNIQNASDAIFHRISLDEMGTFMNGFGNCSTSGGVVNPSEPVVNAGANYTIPINTPFELTGTATDADGDVLTYNWEQFDIGVQQPLATGDNGSQPLFRSWLSELTPTRVFPRLGNLLAGNLAPGETLPTTNRTMNFRLTARDNRASAGREGDDAMTVTSTTTAGPFAVTAPNGGEAFAGGSVQMVTWTVAGTNGGAVNTPNVNITLSTDGGQTYPITLAANTPNDGAETVTLPGNVSSPSVRVKVKGAGNVFFDVSNANFSINALTQCNTPGSAIPDPGNVTDTMTITGGNILADLNAAFNITHTWVSDLTVSLTHVASGTTVTLIDRPGFPATQGGCDADDIIAELDDEATAPVETQCNRAGGTAISGVFTPNNPLSAFDGLTANSNWTVTVADVFGGDSGTLVSWCLGGSYQTGSVKGDLNGDGRSDVLWRNANSGQNWLYTMNGAAIETNGPINIVGAGWAIVGNGDYNGDGKADVLWRNANTGQNYMYLMNGATITSSVLVNTVGGPWTVVGSGDMNGDGKADILWRNPTTGQNYLYLMNGSTITSSVLINTVAGPWAIVGNGDMNGDGKADILWRNPTTGQNYVYLMNGSAITSSVLVNTVTGPWNVVGNGDMNGDGKADILWRNATTGQNYLYLMNGSAITSSVLVNTVTGPWSVVGNGDYNGDGNADILWRNTTTGQNYMYLMNGATITSSVLVNTVPTDWQISYTN